MNSGIVAGSRRRRESTPLLLCSVLLAAAVFAAPAEGSLPRAGLQDANPAVLAGAEAVDSGQLLATGLETPFSLIMADGLEEALARNPAPEASGLNLVESSLLEPPELTSRGCEARFSLRLEPVDFGLNPQRGPPLEIPDLHQGEFVAEPKTRIGGFGLELENLIKGECPLSLGSRRGYEVEGWGIAEEERPDPWGLATDADKRRSPEVRAEYCKRVPKECSIWEREPIPAVEVQTATAPKGDRKAYVQALGKAGIYGLDAQVLAAEKFPVPWIEKYKAYSVSSDMRFWGPAIEFTAGVVVGAFGGPTPEAGLITKLQPGGELAREAALYSARGELARRLRFLARARELSKDVSGAERMAEGFGGARLEIALGRSLTRSTDEAFDFVDSVYGAIEMKGPFVTPSGKPVPPGVLDLKKAANTIIEEINTSQASKTVAIDTFGLTAEQAALLKSTVTSATKDAKKRVLWIQ